nr:DUF86 domain-containing protein [Methanothrix sp.]
MFEKLASSGVLSREVVERAKRMKGFRNILVRRYGYVDDRIVYEMVTGHLDDFDTFRKEVLNVLADEPDLFVLSVML